MGVIKVRQCLVEHPGFYMKRKPVSNVEKAPGSVRDLQILLYV
jgi:hypothetical protein